MADYRFANTRGAEGAVDVSVDAGLRAFMLGVFTKLGLGIALAGVLAFVAGTVQPVEQLVFHTPLLYVVQWGPVALLFGSMFFMKNPSPLATGIMYWAIVTMMGLGLGIWVVMAGQQTGAVTRGGIDISLTYVTIAKAFLITASAFGALALWGYTTKRNLGPIGNFAIMALWGVVALSLLNLILPPSSTFEWIIMAAVFGLSAFLVAWETQQLKHGYYQFAGDTRSLAVMTNWGALNFFISFVNMFRIVLMFLSSRD
ncbi:MAG: Bax inhibitor-1/YccA family protein [Hyphomonadaceae bacterium]